MSVPGQRGATADQQDRKQKPFVQDPAVTLPRQGRSRSAAPEFVATPTASVPTATATSAAATRAAAASAATATATSTAAPTDAPQHRLARFDRPLGSGHYLPTYADPELERIVREAAETAREQARAEGYARGWSQGRTAAAEAAKVEDARRRQTAQSRERIEAERISSALSATISAARDVGNVNAPQWNEVADALLDSALELARAVLARELTATGGEVVEAVRIALRGIADGSPVISVNPEDYDTLTELAGSGAIPDDVRLVPDRDVPRGSALARAGARQLLAHLPSALAAAEEVLRG